jgi:hypothetical protein
VMRSRDSVPMAASMSAKRTISSGVAFFMSTFQ